VSYAASAALQKAIFGHLQAANRPSDWDEIPIVDALDQGLVPDTYISIGPETVRQASTKTSRGAEHRITIAVTSASGGFYRLKEIAGWVCEHLDGTRPNLPIGTLCALEFLRAQARRGPTGAARSIDLSFRAIIHDI
jgi:hypothetical protein